MKKILIILLVVLSITSCTEIEGDGYVYSGDLKFAIVRIDGCQYLYNKQRQMFSHKGNCFNPVHQNKRAMVIINNDTL